MCEPVRTIGRNRSDGFTMIELAVVIAIIGIMAALSAPSLEQFFANQRAKAAARGVADAFRVAQAEAIRSGNPHIVFFSANAADANGTAMGNDPTGRTWPLVVVDDGTPALSNCQIDAGETQEHFVNPVDGVSWGFALSGGVAAPGDAGGGNPATGSTFLSRVGGVNTTWVMFRPDGIPVGFDAACTLGGVGSGGGGIYITNGRRDYAVVLSPLGSVKVHFWNVGTGAWTD